MPRFNLTQWLWIPTLCASACVVTCAERHYDPCADESRTWAWVYASYETTCGMTTTGQVMCWGRLIEDDGSPIFTGEFSGAALGGSLLCTWLRGAHPDCLDFTGEETEAIRALEANPYTDMTGYGGMICGLLEETGRIDCQPPTRYLLTPPERAASERPVARDEGAYRQIDYDFILCGLTDRGQVHCWTNEGLTVSVDLPSPSYEYLARGGTFLCAITPDGRIECTGEDPYGQLSPPSGAFESMVAGWAHGCALKESGEVECWGAEDTPQGYDEGGSIDFGQADPPDERFKQIAAGSYHTCGVTPEGRLLCWGDNRQGQGCRQ